ncbi:hypothetical protein [Streptomyces adelaidensis]|uniref:hypothetical protein n=1 Tax=Streptomyces adelaidensis TaxID=2796465 RepID=UPI00190345D3|nr:hypothetical protein [Streptomyces adelaidensis]
MRNRIAATAIAAAASIAVLGGTGQAFAAGQAEAAAAKPAKLTVAAYKGWLKKAPGGGETSKAFGKLSADWTATPEYKSAGAKSLKKHQFITGLGDTSWACTIGNLPG